MATPEQEYRALEARRLAKEPLLVEALTEIRMSALLALANVDATNQSEILRHQAIASVCMSFVEMLETYIVSGATQKTDQPA